MKILIAPDKFKGSVTAGEVCTAVEKGIKKTLPVSQITKLPLADGGEGSLDVLEKALNFKRIYLEVNNPLFKPHKTYYGLLNKTAYVEMAKASGLQLLKNHERNPMKTTSFGTGEMILDAIQKGATVINLFVGGSASNDAGMGIAAALGVKFTDEQKKLLEPVGENLLKIKNINTDNTISLDKVKINLLTDVDNTLYGKNGAAFVYAKQKGADEKEIKYLDKGLKNISKIITKITGKDISKIPGSGAAGGVFAGISVFCNAEIKNGIDLILDLLNINSLIQQNDLIITGEGLLDKQTLKGKVVTGVAERCKKYGKPFAVICGDITLSKEEILKLGAVNIKPIKTKNITKESSMKNAYRFLIERTEELMKELKN